MYKKSYSLINFDVEKKEKREGNDSQDEESAPTVVTRINRICSQVRQLDGRLKVFEMIVA